jgi:hypothetical protein
MLMTTMSDLHLGLAPMPDPSVLGLTTMFGSSMTARPTCLRSGIQKKKRMGLTWLLGLGAWVKNKIKKY